MIDFQKISEEYGIILHQVVPGDRWCKTEGEDHYVNRSFCAGRDEIWLGIYEDPDWKTVSFFHELGHCLTQHEWTEDMLKFHYELDAWLVGLQLGQEYGYYVKPKTLKKFVMSSLFSYLNWEKKEIQNPTKEIKALIRKYHR